jgi:hypothetical protein
MADKEWAASLELLHTRSEVRISLAAALAKLNASGLGQASMPDEIGGLATGSDREVMESYLRVRKFCEGRSKSSRRLSASQIGAQVRSLFGVALDRMKKLPPEPSRLPGIVSAGNVKRG